MTSSPTSMIWDGVRSSLQALDIDLRRTVSLELAERLRRFSESVTCDGLPYTHTNYRCVNTSNSTDCDNREGKDSEGCERGRIERMTPQDVHDNAEDITDIQVDEGFPPEDDNPDAAPESATENIAIEGDPVGYSGHA